ncbi:MAG: ABC transporter permease [Anaerolineae bacterium]
MNRVWVVASYEFMSNIRKPSFLFALFGLPLLMGGLFAIIALVSVIAATSGEVREDAIGYVDSANLTANVPSVPEGWQAFESEEAARAAVDAGTIDGYFLLDQRFLRTGQLAFYVRGSTSVDLDDMVEAFIVSALVSNTQSELPAERLEEPVRLNLFLLNTQRFLTPVSMAVLLFVPVIFMVVFMMGMQFSSSFLMSGIVEEKTNRVIELLLTTLTPGQLLSGKILGLGALALLQLLVWIVIGVVAYLLTQNLEALEGFSLPIDVVVIALVYFILTYFFYGSLLAGIGAVVDSEEESRQYAGIISLALVIPLFFLVTFLADPSGPIPTVLSYVPFTAAMSVTIRVVFGAITPIEVLASMGILFASTLLVIWASARIFRFGILMTGKRVTLREVAQVLRSSNAGGRA